jgi:holliday junction DNA helicase RuvA
MIARLVGRLVHKSPESIIVDVNGVGYEVFASLNTFYALPSAGENVELEIQTQVRENAIELFGFRDAFEKAVFSLLLTVAGVGPRMALGILSGMTAPDLIDALANGDLARLVRVPGVGKKRAERLVVELRDRVQALRAQPSGDVRGRSRVEEEAISALVNLGYRRTDAEQVVREVLLQGTADLADVIRLSLKRLTA